MENIKKIRKAMKDINFLELNEPVWMHPGIYIYYLEKIKGVISIYTGIDSDEYTPVTQLSFGTRLQIANNI